jgi:pilus assembly protein Flp/PilA
LIPNEGEAREGAMRRFLRCAAAPLQDDRGATAIEYALLAALIAGGLIGVVGTLGQSVRAGYVGVGDELAAAQLAQQAE